MILPVLSGDYAALYQAREGRWERIAEVGVSKNCPADLLAEVLDREQCVISNNWAAMLLAPRSERTEVLAVHLTDARSATQKPGTLGTQLDAAFCRARHDPPCGR